MHGGKHAYNQGRWTSFNVYEDAVAHAKSIGKKNMRPCLICLTDARY